MSNCEICDILPKLQPEHIIYEGKYWVANLRENDQSLLGTSFVTARRHVPELDQLTPEEDAEFIIIRNALIKATQAAFRPITFNVSCLKNDAFKRAPDDTPSKAGHVHWHFKPRYGSEPIKFADEIFADPAPGRYLNIGERHRPAVETAVAITAAIKANIFIN